MRNILRSIMLTMLLFAAQWVVADGYEIDRVCVGAERHYRIDGEDGSVYTWLLTDELGVVTTLPEDGDAVTIVWSVPVGTYNLSVTQLGINGCDMQELGFILVVDPPEAFAGDNLTLCSPDEPILLNLATAENYSALTWTTSGDGNFDDATLLNATYFLGANDIANGSVALTLTAEGLGNDGSCEPAGSTITITINSLLADIEFTPASCYGTSDGSVTFTASGGTEPYTYNLDGNTNDTGLFEDLAAGTYTYIISDDAGCEITDEITIDEPEAILATVTTTDVDCYGAANGIIEITNPVGGSGNYEYRINGGAWQTETTFSDLAPGTYVVEARDVNAPDCIVDLGTYPIGEPEELLATVTPTDVDCFGAENGSIEITDPAGGSGNYEYRINGGAWQTETTFTGLTPGDYLVEVRDMDAPDCIVELGTYPIGEPEELLATVTPLLSEICLNETVQFTSSTSGGTGTLTHAWTGTGAVYLSATDVADPLFTGTLAGNYTLIYTVTDENDCNAIAEEAEVIVNETITPTFDPIGPLCQNSIAPDLELTSLEGITGTWDPATIATDVAGTFTFTFTPDDAAQCGIPTTMEIVITDEILPTFDQIGPLCQNSIAPDLELTSLEGITGTWDPATIATDVAGTFTFTFTPDDAAQCGIPTIMEIVITDEILPTFDQIGPLCQNSIAPDLELTSLEGITGTWDPATIATDVAGTFTFTFTPDDAAQCGIPTTMEIVITDEILPTFDQIGPLCQNSIAPDLPLTSLEGITGTWDPATINTAVFGTTTYTFTPDAGVCAVVVTMDITINEEITPTFAQIGPLCQNSTAPDLPLTSLEGITGTWDPATINTSVAGFFTFTFTPDAGQCAIETAMVIEVSDEIEPTFDQIGPLCQNSTAPVLPTTSLEGITGIWTPATINTSVPGLFTFTFTPDAGQCGIETTMVVEINSEIVPTIIIAAYETTICAGTTVNFTSSITGGGANPTYQWYVNGVEVTGATSDTWASNTLIDGDRVTCELTSSDDCANPVKVVSNTKTITVIDLVTPDFAQIGPLCQNTFAPPLPLRSINGITGTWSPPIINTTITGTTTYTFTPDPGECAVAVTMDIEVTDLITPLFAQIGPLCLNSAAPLLPLTSTNGVTGTWNPAVINTSVIGITTYTFIPDEGQCGVVVTMDIEVTDEITPLFVQIGPLCLNSVAPALPATSTNGITGDWTPANINTSLIGTTTYTFTPDADQCAVVVTMDIEVTDEITPLFAQIGTLCQNSVAPALPTTSTNGVTGNWNPAVINTAVIGTTTYTFTPDAGQCAVVVTMDIEVTDEITPLFTQIGPLCLNSIAPLLPLTSTNGITGTWDPATINTTIIGTTTYTFTPDPDQCAIVVIMDIEVTDQITPLFAQIGPLCQNSVAPLLPVTSTNGITGTWSPTTINTAAFGTTTYAFTPDDDQCAIGVTMDIEVIEELTPAFTQIGPLCQNTVAPVLPLTSINGIDGTWTPATINTTVFGTTTFTFTPDAGQCAVVVTMDIIVNEEITPTFTQIGPLCQNSTAPLLPATSTNGVAGAWDPATINTSTAGITTYTFTPDAGLCAVEVTMDIEVGDEIMPLFTQIDPLCLNSEPPALPLISDNGISGTWSPATINTSVNNSTTTYTFTPDAGECAVATEMQITVSSPEIIALDLEPTTFFLPNGSVIIIANEGLFGPLVYSITGNGTDWQTSNEFTGLSAGPYVAWVMDANGCTDFMEFEILNKVEGEVTISAESREFCMNIPVIIPVDGNNFTQISSFYIELEFNTAVLSFNGLVQIHPALAGGSFSPSITGNILGIRWSIFDGSASVPNGEPLFLLNFDALAPGYSPLTWNLLNCEIFESAGNQVPDIYVEGEATINPAPAIYASNSGDYCEGDSLTLISGSLDGDELNYLWTGPTGHEHNAAEWQLGTLGMNDNGHYSIVATNKYFCTDRDSLDLIINPKPVINLGYADTVCYSQVLLLNPGSGFETYLWNDGSSNQTLLADEPGLYFVSVMDEKGCSAVDSVALIPCNIDLLIPTAFTPDGDDWGLNEIFKPYFRGWEPSKYRMQVYSRWGQLLFETNDYTTGWDGRVEGVMSPPGVYSYIISFEAPSYVTRLVSSPVAGSFTLIR
ncbi:MAG: gliding motility-associated C-terminal domain-containing protein [Lentimicrobium sp.]|nr:gliding motility-associated C-terminal domain-containing protein [Lentimicrobium sp.]